MPVETNDDASEPTVEEILAEVERRRSARRAETARDRPAWERQTARWAGLVGQWFLRHWLAILNLWWFLYVGIPFLAPVLMKANIEGPARLVYLAYQPLCHQLPYRSWYLFGEQPFYSMEELLRRGVAPELLVPHGYIGDSVLGYKVPLCQRDTAIYGTIFLAGVAFALTHRRWRPLPLWAYLLFGVVPVALDGGIQFVSQILVLLFPTAGFVAVESTPLRRVITGALFGLATVWMVYPYVHRATREASGAATKPSP
ncbi:MAG: DUF2085 domain-containing protein [Thermoflexales bacterium]|nr:DUF2085 domain-containing protein [Thermoflexales bacterium]